MELKPCKCGAPVSSDIGDEGGYYIMCPNCKLEFGLSRAMSASLAIGECTYGEYETKQEAIEAWNQRGEG